jgi:drug/metabolite transporter (DMT)-like permease
MHRSPLIAHSQRLIPRRRAKWRRSISGVSPHSAAIRSIPRSVRSSSSCALISRALAAATGEIKPVHASGASLLALVYLIGPGSLLALTCYVVALRRLPVSIVSTYAYANPVVAVGLGSLLLGERLTWTALVGGAIVVGSVALLLINRDGRGGRVGGSR